MYAITVTHFLCALGRAKPQSSKTHSLVEVMMSFRLFKSILKSTLICLASTACNKASSSNTKTSKLACDVGVAATLDAVKKVYTSLIDNEAIKSLSDRSITSTQSLRPTMSQQDFSIALRELDELSSDPSETTRLLDDFKDHLYGLSDAPPP